MGGREASDSFPGSRFGSLLAQRSRALGRIGSCDYDDSNDSPPDIAREHYDPRSTRSSSLMVISARCKNTAQPLFNLNFPDAGGVN